MPLVGLGQRLAFRQDNDQRPTPTSKEQAEVEAAILECFETDPTSSPDSSIPELLRARHTSFLLNGLRSLGSGYVCLDSSRPWLCYWILHSLALLNVDLPLDVANSVVLFLENCVCERSGGFCGGPGQLAHLAPTYAAVSALCALGTPQAYSLLDRLRPQLYNFLMARKCRGGGFSLHDDGEIDVRGCYTAIAVGYLLNVLTPELVAGVDAYVARCQTYEGGLGGEPGNEAHGGYSYCGLAALYLIRRVDALDTDRLLAWMVSRQMSFEGGFCGRTNKLVDGCYSFWLAAMFPLIQTGSLKTKIPESFLPSIRILDIDDSLVSIYGDLAVSDAGKPWLFDAEALQEYIVYCTQAPAGGLRDKPGKAADFYHTCYCLSGLSVAQFDATNSAVPLYDDQDLLVRPVNAALNLTVRKARDAIAHFRSLPPLHPS
eukprot:gnl/Spiro4/9894_TR5246_c0_g1_i1.p1 gnl/Spiro4/9894_TR5246_c0_g1~~gnl/Spiro4/9894_TR5246_c0_g1_i1.p1  ORF type:complete len:431 (+),score=103.85 gnl/Spiro4/9894_TR5246_c0_g1_i1:106-1398(+)